MHQMQHQPARLLGSYVKNPKVSANLLGLGRIENPTSENTGAFVTKSAHPYRSIPLLAIVLVALAVHGPLLFMRLPANSYDTNFHIFFASHYAQHWFNPWNEKWFAGFSQTTYPPLTHQWIAMISTITGLEAAYMIVQLIAIVLLTIGVYRFSRLWVAERAASYAALGSVFIGALAFLVYQAGQLATVSSAALYLNALPYFYEWTAKGRWGSLFKGIAVSLAAAAAHHVTLIFGAILFAIPVLWLAVLDVREKRVEGTTGGVLTRAIMFGAVVGVGIAAVLLPYWIQIIRHPIHQMPIPHDSRSNYFLNFTTGINYFLVPYGPMLLTFPFILWRGASVSRLRPLLLGFWVTFILALGGSTPIPKLVLGRAFDILTFERFTLWAAVLALPLVGLIAAEILDRFQNAGAVVLGLAAICSFGLALTWLSLNPYRPMQSFDVQPVINFLNRDGHDKYRFLTLGFGSELSKVSTYANAGSVDGDYNSARLLPEMTQYGSAQLTNSKFYAAAGMESLRAMLRHSNQYGLKFIFVRDTFYEPLLTFTGWQKIETYDSGLVTLWTKNDVSPAHTIASDAMPTAFEGLLWGTLPIGSSFLAILLVILFPERHKVQQQEDEEVPFGAEHRYVA